MESHDIDTMTITITITITMRYNTIRWLI